MFKCDGFIPLDSSKFPTYFQGQFKTYHRQLLLRFDFLKISHFYDGKGEGVREFFFAYVIESSLHSSELFSLVLIVHNNTIWYAIQKTLTSYNVTSHAINSQYMLTIQLHFNKRWTILNSTLNVNKSQIITRQRGVAGQFKK